MSTGAMTRMAKRGGESFLYKGFTEVDVILSKLSLPGVNGPTGNFAETDADPFFDVLVGDLDLRMDLIMPDYTPSVNPHQKMVNKDNLSGLGRAWSWNFNSNTSNQIQIHSGLSSIQYSTFEVVPAALDGTRLWLRWTHERDNGDGNKQGKFFYSLDGSLWVLLDTIIQAGVFGAGNPASSTSIAVGGNANDQGPRLEADVFEVQVRDGVGGPKIYNPLFKDQPAGTLVFPESKSGADTTILQNGTPQAEIVTTLLTEQERDEYGDVNYLVDPDPPFIRGVRVDTTDRVVLMQSGEERKVDIAVIVPNPLKDSNGVGLTVQDDMTERAVTLTDGSGRIYKVIGTGHEAENPVGATRLLCVRQAN